MGPDQRQDPEDPREDADHTGDPNRVGMGMSASSSDFAWQSSKINDQKNSGGNERHHDEDGENPINHEPQSPRGRQTQVGAMIQIKAQCYRKSYAISANGRNLLNFRVLPIS
jgi:hypothetical protein